MGNCFTTKVDNHTSTTTKSPTPEDSHPQVAVVGVYGRKDSVVCVDTGGQGEGREDLPSSGKIATARSLKRFTLAELTAATKNFHPESVIGEGGFGKVFKGWVDEKTYAPSKPGVGMPVAVKKSNSDSYQTLREWKAEVQFLGKFSHPNLVNLLGYCWEEGQFLLVYEYMQEGSLESHLFGRRTEILSWETRLKIAIGAAQGLAFLHSSENCVIYRDFKTSNILLDAACNSKLSDFGLARTGPTNGHSHVTTRLIGTHGYAAPEYLATGHLYMKSDVYGFGVVLLELLTGLKAVDSNRPGDRHNLVDWMRPFLADKRKLKKIIDPKLDDRFPQKGVFWTAQLILKCLQRETKNRPSMEQVLVTLQSIKTIKKMSPEN